MSGRHAHAPMEEPTVEPTVGMLAHLSELASRAAVHSWAAATRSDQASLPVDDQANQHSIDPATEPVPDAGAIERLADLASAAARAAAINASGLRQTSAPGQTEQSPQESWRCGWTALLLSSVARAGLILLACLLVTSVAFTPLGWQSTVVMSDSMAPRLNTGDVVIARPVPTKQLRVGQVLLVTDPDHANQLRLHRLALIRPDGMLTLRGDANAANDSTPVAPSAVHGVGSLRVPYIGTAMWLLSTKNYRDLAILVAILAGLLAAACLYSASDDHIDNTEDTDLGGANSSDSGQQPRHRCPADSLPADARRAHSHPAHDGQPQLAPDRTSAALPVRFDQQIPGAEIGQERVDVRLRAGVIESEAAL